MGGGESLNRTEVKRSFALLAIQQKISMGANRKIMLQDNAKDNAQQFPVFSRIFNLRKTYQKTKTIALNNE